MLLSELTHYTDQVMSKADARQALTTQEISINWYTNRENKQSIVHSHPYYYEMIYPLQGEVLYSYDGNLVQLHTGELICFPVNVYHSGRFDVGKEVSNRIVAKIDRKIWEEALEVLHFECPVWNHEVTILNQDMTTKWNVPELFLRMSQSAQMKNTKLRRIVLRCELIELLAILEQNLSQKNHSSSMSSNALVGKVVHYLQMHYADPDLSVADVAQKYYVSREHLSRKFKEYTLESVQSYIINLRMQHCRLAIEEGKSILEACTESGFSDYSSFLKSFRKIYGITPTEYRNNISRG